MIYLLHGKDTDKSREKLRELLASLQAKKPDASVFKMDERSFSVYELEERIVGQGLFEQKYIVVLDNVFENTDAKDIVLKNIKDLGSSRNIFIFLESKLDKKTLTKIEKYTTKTQEFSERKGDKEQKKEKDFNIFALSDAFGKRDKKQAWRIFRNAIDRGMVAENIHGTIFWGVKSMILVQSSKSATDAGMSPYVFSKSRTSAKNFEEGELENISSELVSIYHDAHGGKMEMEIALELFLLSH